MNTITRKTNYRLSYNLPTEEDYTFIKQLLETEFYQFAKSNWNVDDIIEGNTLLPFNNRAYQGDGEFNYIINNKVQQRIGYIKGYYPINKHYLWIQILVVDTPFIRRGYGRIIIEELVLHLLENSSIDSIYLTCHNYNITGIYFWESLGFKRIVNIKSTHGLYKTDLRSLTCIPNHLKP